MFDFLDVVWAWLGSLAGNFMALINWLWNNLQLVYLFLVKVANDLWNGVRFVASKLLAGLKALTHLKFSEIWAALKRAYERFRRLYNWLKRNFYDPIEKMRQQILGIYNRFFKPILRVLDTFRVFTHLLALFDRKLAAKLDSYLFQLESKLLTPITAALKRLNEISSQIRAYFTILGYLDRTTFLETMRRDALKVWEVLTNPRGVIFPRSTAPAPGPPRNTIQDARDFMLRDTGPLADESVEWERTFNESFLEL